MDEEIQDEESLNLEIESEDLNLEEEDDSNAEVEKLKQIAENQRIRAEKAERLLKEKKQEPNKNTKQNDMSLKDIRALNDVHDDDVDDILDYAKYKGIAPSEAKKMPAMVAILKAKEEDRRVALATNTGGGKRGTAQVSDERVLQDFSQGKVSENDSDIERLAEARFNLRKNRN